MSGFIKPITDESFEQDVIYSDKPVLVDFWSSTCGICHELAPVLEDIAATYGEQITFVKINMDEYSQKATEFNIMSIPTLILFKNGQIAETKTGAPSKSELSAFLDNHINYQPHYRWG